MDKLQKAILNKIDALSDLIEGREGEELDLILASIDKLTEIFVRSANIEGYIKYKEQAQKETDNLFGQATEDGSVQGKIVN